MSESLGDVRYRALADPTRRHLLRVLDDAEEPMGLDELSVRIGLHVNTVRGHLDLLQRAQLVDRRSERRNRPGRPRVLFTASASDARSPTAEGYRFLAEILAAWISESAAVPQEDAERAGERWGRHIAADTVVPVSDDEAIEQLVSTFAGLGFQPELHDSDEPGTPTELRLHDCPFRELARAHGEVVCSVHAGLVRGMLAEMADSVSLERLVPFVEPSLCVATLDRR